MSGKLHCELTLSTLALALDDPSADVRADAARGLLWFAASLLMDRKRLWPRRAEGSQRNIRFFCRERVGAPIGEAEERPAFPI